MRKNRLFLFRLWMLKNRLIHKWNKIKTSRCFVLLANSLIAKVFYILAICFFILWLIFLFLPQNGYMNYKSEDYKVVQIDLNDAILEAEANGVTMNTEGETVYQFEDTNLFVQGKPLFDEKTNFKLVVNGKANTHFMSLHHQTDDIFSLSILGTPSRLLTTGSYTEISTQEPFEYYFHANSASFSGEMSVELEFGAIQNIESFYVIHQDETIPLNIPTLKQPILLTSDYSVSARITGSCMKFNVMSEYQSVSLDHIFSANTISIGEVIFNHSSNSQSYQLENQMLEFRDENVNHIPEKSRFLSEALQGYIEYQRDNNGESKNINIYGKLTDISVAGFNLFPTFTGWISENIYLIALSLLSSIFGAITLKKKQSSK
jgi:hypothetical protein